MDRFIQTNTLTWLREHIPGSVTGETVTIKVRRDSDGYWWNFTSLAFAAADASGAMTFDADGVWKASFTPSAAGTYSVWLTYDESTLFHMLAAVGTPAPAAYGGTGLVTEEELESFLETSIDSTLAASLINSATAFLERVCGRVFREATYTNEYLSGDGTPFLYLKNYPITSITSLTLFDRYAAADVQTFTADRDYYLDDETGRIVAASGCFTEGRKNYRCTYVGGYSTIPEDLKVLCMNLISYWINKKGNAGIESQTIGKYSATYKTALPEEILSSISLFTRMVF